VTTKEGKIVIDGRIIELVPKIKYLGFIESDQLNKDIK
jgi:formylmethanofuran dehydrogenase subunit C